MRRLLFLLLAGTLALAGRAGADTKAGKKVQGLLKDLKSSRVQTRVYAARELGHPAESRITDRKAAVPALPPALKDASATVRKEVIDALLKVEADPGELVPRLAALVEKDRDPTVRVAAVQALGQIGPPAKAAVEALKGWQKALRGQK